MKHDVWPDDAVESTVSQSYVPLPIEVDRDRTVAGQYGVHGIPTILVLDAGLQHESLPKVERRTITRRGVLIGAAAVALAVLSSLAVWRIASLGGDDGSDRGQTGVVQTVRSGDLEIVLLSPTSGLQQGRNSFTIEFRRAGTETLVDVGTVRASANMPMPGMVMSSGLQVEPTRVPGRYAATAEFGMAGAWQMSMEWEGPAGRGSVNFEGGVQ